MSLSSFFEAKNIAIVGASTNPDKLGSIILSNVIQGEFMGKIFPVNPKYPQQEIQGYSNYASVAEIPHYVDLVVIVVPAKFVSSVVDDCIANKSKNIIIISAGFKEAGHPEMEAEILQKCQKHEIRLLGPNCLGAIFPHNRLNASFSDGHPNPGGVCLISQSGAFCTAMLDWATEKNIGFSHMISLGNKSDINENDILEFLQNDPKIKLFALYLEDVSDGKKLIKLLQKITPHKPVIILEPGQSAHAAKASSSHTGSLAPNFRILQSAYKQSGVLQVYNMRDMTNLVMHFAGHSRRIGHNTAIITNAGGVGVMSTDIAIQNGLHLECLSPSSIKKLWSILPEEASIDNPIDIIGDADASRYEHAFKVLIKDNNIDQILVLLTPQKSTQIMETAYLIEKYANKSNKSFFSSFIGGEKVAPARDYLRSKNLECFNFPESALKIMGILAEYQDFLNNQKSAIPRFPYGIQVPEDTLTFLRAEIQESITNNHESLPHSINQKLCLTYDLTTPLNLATNDIQEAQKFAEHLLEKWKIVLKISAPGALHKTELKGIFTGIEDINIFQSAWGNLQASIQIAKLHDAKILIQQQVENSTEVIIGLHTDPNFGDIMLFGSGGVYTEFLQDTSLTLLPAQDFSSLINETKISEILSGVRGQKSKNITGLINTMEKLEKLFLDFPEIKSIDCNPVMVTEDRTVCVDLKFILK